MSILRHKRVRIRRETKVLEGDRKRKRLKKSQLFKMNKLNKSKNKCN